MRRMKFKLVKRVPVVEVNGVSSFIDTGFSCADGSVRKGVQDFFGIPGLRVQGVDSLKRYTKFDYANGEIITSDAPICLEGGKSVPLVRDEYGWLVEMEVGGINGHRYIDTGAAYSYVPGVWHGFESAGKVGDCGFGGNPWVTEAHKVPCSILGDDFVVLCGNTDDNLEYVPPKGVIGYDFFKNFTVVADRDGGMLTYK